MSERELRCPICEETRLADKDGRMVWHETDRADGERVLCPGIGAGGTDPDTGQVA